MINPSSDPIPTGLRTPPLTASMRPTPQITPDRGDRLVQCTLEALVNVSTQDIDRVFPLFISREATGSSSSSTPRPIYSGLRSPIPVNPKIDILNKNLDGIIKKYDEDQALYEGIEKLSKQMLFIIEYISINRKNFINFITTLHPKWTFQTEAILQCLHETYQWGNFSIPFIISLVKYKLVCCFFQQRLDIHKKECNNLRDKSINVQQDTADLLKEAQIKLEKLNIIVEKEKEETWRKGRYKFLKLSSKVGALGIKTMGISHETAGKASKSVLNFFQYLLEIWELAQVIYQQNIWLKNFDGNSQEIQSESLPKEQNVPYRVMTVLKDALESKNRVERKFFMFRTLQATVGLFASTLQFAVCHPDASFLSKHLIVKMLTSSLTQIGSPTFKIIFLCFPLYPDLSLKIDKLFMQMTKFFFAKVYKPNEYSLEGYHLTLQIRWSELNSSGKKCIFLLQQTLLWIKIRIIEQGIMRFNSGPSTNNDRRYIDLKTLQDQHIDNHNNRMKHLKKRIEVLQIKDAHLIMCDYMMRNHCDPIQEIIEALKEVDVESFPVPVLNFFKTDIGFSLNNKNIDDFKIHLEKFFCSSEEDFIKLYQAIGR